MSSKEVEVLAAAKPDLDRPLNLAGGLSLAEAKTIGQLFYQSGMFKDMQSGAQAVTKILAGQELGIPPMQAMNGYHIVDGQPRLSSGLIGALVKRSGKYDYRVTEANDTLCHIEWFQADYSTRRMERVGESEFTLKEAQTAGLATRTNWKTYAEDMLFARALTRGARRFCPDVFNGAVYALGEEAEDDADRPDHARLALPSLRTVRGASQPADNSPPVDETGSTGGESPTDAEREAAGQLGGLA